MCHFLYRRNGQRPKEILEQTQTKKPEASISLLLHQTRKNRDIPEHYSLTHYTMWLFKHVLEQEFFLLLKKMHLLQHCFLKYQHIGYTVCICTEHQQKHCLENLQLNLTNEPGLWKPLCKDTQEGILEARGGGGCREGN